MYERPLNTTSTLLMIYLQIGSLPLSSLQIALRLNITLEIIGKTNFTFSDMSAKSSVSQPFSLSKSFLAKKISLASRLVLFYL
jgi:hypothetical protein